MPDDELTICARPALQPSRHVQRVARLIEQGADARDLVAAVLIELTGLLVARACRFEPAAEQADGEPATRRLARDGTVSGTPRPTDRGARFEIPVQLGARRIGRFLVDLNPGASITLERGLMAVMLADHLAAAIDAECASTPHTTKGSRWSRY